MKPALLAAAVMTANTVLVEISPKFSMRTWVTNKALFSG